MYMYMYMYIRKSDCLGCATTHDVYVHVYVYVYLLALNGGAGRAE